MALDGSLFGLLLCLPKFYNPYSFRSLSVESLLCYVPTVRFSFFLPARVHCDDNEERLSKALSRP